MNQSNKYPVKIMWSEEENAFLALAPDLPGCSAIGDSWAEALSELEHAVAAWTEAAIAAGNTIPAPSKVKGTDEYSGKFLIRIPKTLHATLAEQAEMEGISLNQHVTYQLTQAATVGCIRSFMDSAKVVMISTPAFHRIEGFPTPLRGVASGNTSVWGVRQEHANG